MPVWYRYEPGGALRFVTGARSRKAQADPRRPAASASACRPRQPPYQYVSVEGPATLGEPDYERDVREVAIRYLGEQMGADVPGDDGRRARADRAGRRCSRSAGTRSTTASSGDSECTSATRAVLFDFGGTLYDYACLATGDRECLLALAQWAGIDADEVAIRRAQRDAMRRVFHVYLPRRFYLHRDLFRDAAAGMLESFGVTPDAEHLERFRQMQWDRHRRDFVLRDGVIDTLQALRARGLHVGMVSNIDDDQLDHLIDVAGLRDYFDSLLSSEAAGACKPDPAIFSEALRRAGCAPARRCSSATRSRRTSPAPTAPACARC